MKVQWLEKNVDLNQLCECIVDFFKKEGFSVLREESGSQVSILATRKYEETPLSVTTRVEGKPSDFSIEIECIGLSRSSFMFTQFMTVFGLGFLAYKKIKMQDLYTRLEERFWAFMEDAINNLTGSRTC